MYKRFLLHIALPTLLTVVLFLAAIFLVFIPATEKSIMDRKREMIRELTVSAWNILASFERDAASGKLSRAEAQQAAVRQIRNLAYGPEMKDYFWINDLRPRMVVHPYRPDLEGQDLSGVKDPEGKLLFVEFVRVAREKGEGFVEYRWQWKDDARRIDPKLSFVKLFEPWGWVIGTGVYLTDVHEEIAATTRRLALYSSGIMALVAALLATILYHSLQTERARTTAERALRESEERYRMAVESAGESIIMSPAPGRLYANANALKLLGYTAAEFAGLDLRRIIELTEAERQAGYHWHEGHVEGRPAPTKHESRLVARDGRKIPVMISYSPLTTGGQEGVIVVATDITERKQAEEALGRSQVALREQLDDLRQFATRHDAAVRELRAALLMLERPGGEPLSEVLASVRAAGDAEQVAAIVRRGPVLVRGLTEAGWRAGAACRLLSLLADAAVDALLRQGIARLGAPPVPFAFILMGSQGRREQTLCTDQDNAILFADVPDSETAAATRYFTELGAGVCEGLALCGYKLCAGDVMARNPKWCLPLAAWQRNFATWVRTLEGNDLLQAKIFFDFRCGWGEAQLIEPLRKTLAEELAANPRFFPQLAVDVLQFRPPLDLFGGIAVEKTEDARKAFDIKVAMTPIVDFARIYSLRHGIEATNTVERLDALFAADALNLADWRELVQAYGALAQLRLENQLAALADGRAPDNLVEPRRLTQVQRRTVRECFEQVRLFQGRLARDFTGMREGLR